MYKDEGNAPGNPSYAHVEYRISHFLKQLPMMGFSKKNVNRDF
jgi:hypothetical protein